MNNPLMKKITYIEYKPSDTYEDRRQVVNKIVKEEKEKKLNFHLSKPVSQEK